nr:GTPase Era [Deltaproteobacteria bacterium]
MMEPTFKSGFIALVGPPNVGKSTLINALVGEKVSIVTPKPQTTRNRILGIKNRPDAQLIFVDTPGIHKTAKKFNKLIVETARSALKQSDIIVLMVDARESEPTEEFYYVIQNLHEVKVPVFLVINKIDLVEKEILLPLIDRHSRLFPFRECIPVSSLTGSGLDRLETCLAESLPQGPHYFPESMYTDQPERFIVAEILREKIFLLLAREIPYSVAVEVAEFTEREDGIILIRTSVWVEKQSQKGILVGKGGRMLKEIGMRARADIERLLNAKVYLDIWVTVKENWTKQDSAIRKSLVY